jgi:hypothetical protein
MAFLVKSIHYSFILSQLLLLDYHHHAEYIVNTLFNCSECYLKLNNNALAIQYATEALQYNKMDTNTLICRAKAFEKEKLYAFKKY